MQVVAMGAAGDMGRTAARHLATNGAISEPLLADLDVARAEMLAGSLAGTASGRVRATVCDVLDDRTARRVLDSADLVLNCSGPLFRLGIPTLRAAIDTTTMYLEICDDPDPTIEMLRLDEDARVAGLASVVGMGASPGISNLLALRAARRLDHVRDCFTGWSLDDSRDGPGDGGDGGDGEEQGLVRADGAPSGAVVHFMEQIHGAVSVVEDGVLVRRPPLDAIELEYPGLDRGTGYVVGHPEAVTLLGSLGLSGRSCSLVVVRDGSTAAFLRGLRSDLDDGDLDLDRAARALLRPSAMRSARAAVAGVALRGGGSLPPLFAWASGTADGRPATVGCHVTAMPRGMAGATAIPAALAAAQLLADRPRPGVHAPEAVIDADRLLTELIPFCTTPVDDLESLAPLHVAVEV